MLVTEQRNRHIFHIIESAIKDYCRLFGTTYTSNHESMLVSFNNKDLLFLLPEFDEKVFRIITFCFVLTDLSISESKKLRDVYKNDSIAEMLKGSDSTLRFMDDSNLVLDFVFTSYYTEFAILKSRLLLEIHSIIQNARALIDKLEALVAEQESISAN
ncbi:MAG: hypothetical protein KDC90_04265 [Ignavibacteriae bacterium]|nr:hypothetical protein [Ignavibacteriota bacterium]